jgi:MFS family permease
MPLDDVTFWIVFIHVATAFVFAAGHGVSVITAFRLRRERERSRIAALLDVSELSGWVALVGLLGLLVSGIIAGIMLGSFERGWIWVSLALLIAIGVAMTPLGTGYFNRVRHAVGLRTRAIKKDQPDPVPVSEDELALVLDNRRPELLLLIGGGGFMVILWLMMFRPF